MNFLSAACALLWAAYLATILLNRHNHRQGWDQSVVSNSDNYYPGPGLVM